MIGRGWIGGKVDHGTVMRSVKSKFPGIALIGGLEGLDSCLQTEGAPEAFEDMLLYLREQNREDGASIYFEFSLSTEPEKQFGKKFLKSRSFETYSTLTILLGSRKNIHWNIALKDHQVDLTMGDEMFAEVERCLELKASGRGDFCIGPGIEPGKISSKQTSRDWYFKNHIFVFGY